VIHMHEHEMTYDKFKKQSYCYMKMLKTPNLSPENVEKINHMIEHLLQDWHDHNEKMKKTVPANYGM